MVSFSQPICSVLFLCSCFASTCLCFFLFLLSFRNPSRMPKGGAVSAQYLRWFRSITSVAAWTTSAAKDVLLPLAEGNNLSRRSSPSSSSPRSVVRVLVVAAVADRRGDAVVDDATATDERKAAATLERSTMISKRSIGWTVLLQIVVALEEDDDDENMLLQKVAVVSNTCCARGICGDGLSDENANKTKRDLASFSHSRSLCDRQYKCGVKSKLTRELYLGVGIILGLTTTISCDCAKCGKVKVEKGGAGCRHCE